MGKLSEELHVRRGDSVRHDEFDNYVFTARSGETGNVRDYTPDRNHEWFLEATIRLTFWADQAQRADAEKIARRTLMLDLYSGVLVDLAYLRKAVSDGDRLKCFATLDRIDRVLTGETP